MSSFTIHNPMDMHLHLREGDMLRSVLPFSAEYFSAGLAMPNLKTPITTTQQALAYKNEIIKNTKTPFQPIMSLYLSAEITKEELLNAKNQGIRILKLYPKGATTGSESGISNILCERTLALFELAQELGFMLSIHCESGGFCMEREHEFVPILERIATDFPRLLTIIEHISDCRTLKLIEKYNNLFGTLTLHHITLNLDDMLGGMLNPHLFCKPMLKTKKDQQALLNVALKAHKKISFGSDSAPHLESAKISAKGSAGIFSAPILLPALVELFDTHNALDSLQAFVSDNAIANYNLQDFPRKCVVLTRQKSQIPNAIQTKNGNIIPIHAGNTLDWRVSEVIGEQS